MFDLDIQKEEAVEEVKEIFKRFLNRNMNKEINSMDDIASLYSEVNDLNSTIDEILLDFEDI